MSTIGVISAVGTLKTKAATTGTTLAVTPTALGNAWLLEVTVASTTETVTGVSGGGVIAGSPGDWVNVGPLSTTFTQVGSTRCYIFLGTIGSLTPSNIVVTLSNTGVTNTFAVQEFGTGGGPSTTWAVDSFNARSNTTSTNVTYPTLTPATADSLYFGWAACGSAPLATGATAGYTATVLTSTQQLIWNPDVTGAQTPIGKQTSSSTSAACGCVVSATNLRPTDLMPLTDLGHHHEPYDELAARRTRRHRPGLLLPRRDFTVCRAA